MDKQLKNKKREDTLEFEIAFYEKLIKDKPDFIDVLVALGDAYTRKGLYEKGLQVDRRLSELLPRESTAWYNLACSLSLLNQVEEALVCLEKAIRLGYREFECMLKDSDLINIKKDKRFHDMLEKFTRGMR